MTRGCQYFTSKCKNIGKVTQILRKFYLASKDFVQKLNLTVLFCKVSFALKNNHIDVLMLMN